MITNMRIIEERGITEADVWSQTVLDFARMAAESALGAPDIACSIRDHGYGGWEVRRFGRVRGSAEISPSQRYDRWDDAAMSAAAAVRAGYRVIIDTFCEGHRRRVATCSPHVPTA